jgi:hypothetical protein
MALQDELMPQVAALLDKYNVWREDNSAFTWGQLILHFQSEVGAIAKASLASELQRQDLDWGQDLWGEDLFNLAQAIWATSIDRPGGGGLLGKALELVGPMIVQALQKQLVEGQSATSQPSASSAPPSESDPSRSETTSLRGSPSSGGAGAEDLKPSATN